MNQALVLRRKAVNHFVVIVAMAMTGLALLWLFAILWGLIVNGLSSISFRMFTMSTSAPGGEGGLLNAIVGSLLMTSIAMAGAVPIGILAGTYLSEYGRNSRFAENIRFVNDILLSAPSILIGLFVYSIAIAPANHFSAWAGSLALGIIAIPILVRTTENMLRLVPDQMREAATAIGAPKWRVTLYVVQRAAFQGLLTGGLLALARVSGETAPLLFTAFGNQFLSYDMSRPMSSLPQVIFQFANSSYPDWQSLAWGGAFLITLTVLLLNIVSRMFAPEKGRI
jgi:phosphate transport system permease protein